MSKKNPMGFKAKARLYRASGYVTTALTTAGGFVVYEGAVDWKNFQTDMQNFILLHEDTLKLNLAVAFPILIVILIYLGITIKKNREFFKDKVSVGLLFTIVILYLFYSVLEVTIASLIGAFVGSVFDDFMFSPLARINKQKAVEQHEEELETNKEKRRILARKQAREDLDGTI